ncbi:MAG: hypothetical protein QF541_04765 [Lentisphaeria bacterium]|jgi:hypothetical protein|nr:hypothetical protein [Lentisphaeria bacterium]
MNKTTIVAAVIVIAGAGIAIWRFSTNMEETNAIDIIEPPPVPEQAAVAAITSTELPEAVPGAAATPMTFARSGSVDAIVTAVERAAKPGKTRMARTVEGNAQQLCILVDGDRRYGELDSNTPQQLATMLIEAGFEKPPQHVSKSMSIYRSLAKNAMNYEAARGDTVIVLLCPQAEWDSLHLSWTGPQRK